MVSLSLMARLVEAVRPEARLILVGDPGQLTSIEAGVVLADIVDAGPGPGAQGKGVVVLKRVHRYGGGIAALADAIRQGDGDATVAALRAAPGEITWLPIDVDETEAGFELVRDRAVAAGLDGGQGRSRGGRLWRRSSRSGGSGFCAPTGAVRTAWAIGAPGSRGGSLQISRTSSSATSSVARCWSPRTTTSWGSTTATPASIVAGGGAGERPAAAFERGGEVLRFSPLRLGRRRHRVRDDDPQEPGLAVRHGGGPAAGADLTHPDP